MEIWGKGFHLIYRCKKIEGNQKLAQILDENQKIEWIIVVTGELENQRVKKIRGQCVIDLRQNYCITDSVDYRNFCKVF